MRILNILKALEYSLPLMVKKWPENRSDLKKNLPIIKLRLSLKLSIIN
jgi:hypothetical protein